MNFYTGIGSRETPDSVLELMENFSYRLSHLGWVLRSGKAAGADSAFQKGAQEYHKDNLFVKTPSQIAEIFIPWKGFKGGEELTNLYDITLDQLDNAYPEHKDMRWDWVKEVHGGWDKLSQGARKLHERNIHQLFGPNLGDAYLNQSKFVVYYALETRGGAPKGGTATAVNLAKKQGIRTINLLHPDNCLVFEKFVKGMEDKRGSIHRPTK